MVARVSLAMVSVLLIGWLAVLVRDELVGSVASDRVFYATHISRPELDRQLDRLRSAELLNPSPKWRRNLAALLALRGRPREAARVSEAIVRAEPDDYEAWTTLLRATERFDPRRATESRAAIARLNPRATLPRR